MSRALAQAIFDRFPAVREFSSDGDEELLYVLMSNLVTFLESQADPSLPMDTVKRVLGFNSWCLEQPRNNDPGTDILTILCVGFYEKLIESEKLRGLITKLMSKSDLVNNREYLLSWVGRENYDRAVALYGDP